MQGHPLVSCLLLHFTHYFMLVGEVSGGLRKCGESPVRCARHPTLSSWGEVGNLWNSDREHSSVMKSGEEGRQVSRRGRARTSLNHSQFFLFPGYCAGQTNCPGGQHRPSSAIPALGLWRCWSFSGGTEILHLSGVGQGSLPTLVWRPKTRMGNVTVGGMAGRVPRAPWLGLGSH